MASAEAKSADKQWEFEDRLWARIEPLLSVVVRKYRFPGFKRPDDRKAMCGILSVLYTGIPERFLPQELGFGSGMTIGVDCATGATRGSGNCCTNCCWPSCGPRTC